MIEKTVESPNLERPHNVIIVENTSDNDTNWNLSPITNQDLEDVPVFQIRNQF